MVYRYDLFGSRHSVKRDLNHLLSGKTKLNMINTTNSGYLA